MKILVSIIGLALSCAAAAQTIVPQQGNAVPPSSLLNTPTKACAESGCFKIDFSTDVNLYKFTSGSIVEVDTLLLYELSEKWTVGASLPIYNDSGASPSETGFGDVDFTLAYDLYDGNLEVLKADKVWVDLTCGVGVPLDGEYSSNSTTFNVGGTVGSSWGKVCVSYTANYEFVDEYTFVSELGGVVNADVYSGVLATNYQFGENLSVGLSLSQFVSDNNSILLLGPTMKYELSNSCSLNASVGVPLSQDLVGDEMDVAVGAGLSLNF